MNRAHVFTNAKRSLTLDSQDWVYNKVNASCNLTNEWSTLYENKKTSYPDNFEIINQPKLQNFTSQVTLRDNIKY